MANYRKKKKKNTYYYDFEQEMGVRDFLKSDDPIEKERIYRDKLMQPINKLIENIIWTYKLHRAQYNYRELHADTLSFLMTKFHKFDPDNNKKSYSYFGTICKNYLLNEMKREQKRGNKKIPYEDISSDLDEDLELSYEIDESEIDHNQFMKDLAQEIRKEMEKPDIDEYELRVGDSLAEVLENWEWLFGDNNGKVQFTKNLVLLTLRNRTNLTTKQIREVMKRRYNSIYKYFKQNYDEEFE